MHHAFRTNPTDLAHRGGTRSGAALIAGIAVALAVFAAGIASADAEIEAVPEVVITGPDPGVDFDGIGGVAVLSSSSEFAVAEGNRGRVLFFGLDGYLLGRAVHRVVAADGSVQRGMPSAIAYDHAGNLLVVDRLAPYVDVLDYTGAFVTRLVLPAPDNDFAAGRGAVAVAVAPDGTILVGSQGDSARIHRFSSDYDYLGSWGIYGREPGQLNGITAIAVAPNGNVVVTCARTSLAVQVFDSQGGFIQGFGVHEIGEGNFSLPGGVVVTPDNRIWVTDEMRQTVQVFDAGGKYLGRFGGAGVAPGEFLYPSALTTDGGLLVVAERLGGRVQVMRLP
jgi:DNA-binding beta-propeller fold protein YncE